MTGSGNGEPAAYSTVQIVLHWAIAALILLQYLIHGAVEFAFDRRACGQGGGGAPPQAVVHLVAGVLILALASVRVGLRLWRGVPPTFANVPWPARWAGHAVHFGLYVLLFALPVSGLWAWCLRSELAAEVHEGATVALIWLVAAHVAGALAEQSVFGNESIVRMIPAAAPPSTRGGGQDHKAGT